MPLGLDPTELRSRGRWASVAAASTAVVILTLLSPQLQSVGRGLRTALPALVIAWFAIRRVQALAFGRAIRRHRWAFLIGASFAAQAGARFAFTDDPRDLVQRYVVGTAMSLVCLWWILAVAELGDAPLARLRAFLFFGWTVSLGLGVPSLLEVPGVARLTMVAETGAENAALWGPLGVGEYGTYTSLAVCIGPLFAIALRLPHLLRVLALLVLAVACYAVMVSTFSMAAVLLIVNAFFTFVIWTLARRGLSRAIRVALLGAVVASAPSLYALSGSIEQIEFVTQKVTGLAGGIATHGLARGDETERGAWFVEEINDFIEEPFLGYIPGVTGTTGHGHSALSNGLVLFGLFGTALWMFVLWKMFRLSTASPPDALLRHTLLLSWVLFLASGILNPSWYSGAFLAPLIACGVASKASSRQRRIDSIRRSAEVGTGSSR